jgi:hypothetical protein
MYGMTYITIHYKDYFFYLDNKDYFIYAPVFYPHELTSSFHVLLFPPNETLASYVELAESYHALSHCLDKLGEKVEIQFMKLGELDV